MTDEAAPRGQEHKQSKIIVYFLTCACVDFFVTVLERLPAARGLAVTSLHGRMKQAAREAALAAFADAPAGGAGFPVMYRMCSCYMIRVESGDSGFRLRLRVETRVILGMGQHARIFRKLTRRNTVFWQDVAWLSGSTLLA